LQEPLDERHRLVAGWGLDDGWMAELRRGIGTRTRLIAEGLLPYFSQEEHRKIFGYLAEHFPGQEMLFQTMAPLLIQGLRQDSSLPKMSANVEVRWGLNDSIQATDLLHPTVRFIQEFPLLEGRYDLLPDPIKQRLSVEDARRAGKIVHVHFDNSPQENEKEDLHGWEKVNAARENPFDVEDPDEGIEALEVKGKMKGTVLDAGCGTGHNALYLAAKGHQAVGVDISPTAIQRAREKRTSGGYKTRHSLPRISAIHSTTRTIST
jgi:Methyltransferase domain